MSSFRIKRVGAQFGHTMVSVQVEMGLPSVDQIKDELLDMSNILLGRKEPPVESPYLALQEVAAAYHSRAREIEMLIYLGELEGAVMHGSQYYKLRTGALRSFIEMTKRLHELGSRRLAQEELLYKARLEGPPL